MFHNRCDSEIQHLRRLLEEERTKNSKLIEQVVMLSNQAAVPLVNTSGEAEVYFMDDARILELERRGISPT